MNRLSDNCKECDGPTPKQLVGPLTRRYADLSIHKTQSDQFLLIGFRRLDCVATWSKGRPQSALQNIRRRKVCFVQLLLKRVTRVRSSRVATTRAITTVIVYSLPVIVR